MRGGRLEEEGLDLPGYPVDFVRTGRFPYAFLCETARIVFDLPASVFSHS